MKYKTAELEGGQLDYAVALIESVDVTSKHCGMSLDGKFVRALVVPHEDPNVIAFVDYAPSTNWAQGGPIIERNRIGVADRVSCWVAGMVVTSAQCPSGKAPFADGPTALVAAMRCYVQFKLGDEVEFPCQHKDTRNVDEGMIFQRCNICGAGKNRMNDWCKP